MEQRSKAKDQSPKTKDLRPGRSRLGAGGRGIAAAHFPQSGDDFREPCRDEINLFRGVESPQSKPQAAPRGFVADAQGAHTLADPRSHERFLAIGGRTPDPLAGDAHRAEAEALLSRRFDPEYGGFGSVSA